MTLNLIMMRMTVKRRIWALIRQQIPSELTLPNPIQESRKFLKIFLSLVKRVGMMERIVVKEEIKAVRSLEYLPIMTHSNQILEISQAIT
jgi:hypothetical protein